MLIASNDKHPKVTQEQVLMVMQVILGTLKDPKYLDDSPYSVMMRRTIHDQVLKVKKNFEDGKVATSQPEKPKLVAPEPIPKAPVELQPKPQYLTKADIVRIEREEKEKLEAEYREQARIKAEREAKMQAEAEAEREEKEIQAAFSSISENIEERPQEYRDQYGILIRMEKLIRSVVKIADSSTTDTNRLSAVSKAMDYQDKQMAILQQLLNIEKVDKIEKTTRKFFTELRKHPDLSVIAERYLTLLDNIE
ncbi:hypothetical protein [Acinetobacter phage vB_AbaS_TCUP2199]|nr:hypothetical protein [Acinetobacter phage vB_AbaS_TCUP2199]